MIFFEAVNPGSRHWSNCSISWNAINVLGGGNSKICYLGKMNPFWRAYFSDGLKPPTSVFSKGSIFWVGIPLFWWVCCCLASAYPRLPKCPFCCVAISTSFIHPKLCEHPLRFPFAPPNTYGTGFFKKNNHIDIKKCYCSTPCTPNSMLK